MVLSLAQMKLCPIPVVDWFPDSFCQPENHIVGGLNSKHLFLTILQARRSKIKVLQTQCLVRAPLLGS